MRRRGIVGGAGFNTKMLAQLMRRAGIQIEEIENVEEVIIRTADADIVIEDASVTVMDAQGSKIFQVMGTPELRKRAAETAEAEERKEEEREEEEDVEIPQEDIELVMAKTGCSEEAARQMLKETGGDLAEAISRLSGEE